MQDRAIRRKVDTQARSQQTEQVDRLAEAQDHPDQGKGVPQEDLIIRHRIIAPETSLPDQHAQEAQVIH